MEPTQKYDVILSAINMDAIYYEVSKNSHYGAPTELNYAAMINSVFIRYVERIPTVKNLIKRLNDDIAFKLNCGFLVSDVIPSEASYSRLLTKLSESNILEKFKKNLSSKPLQKALSSTIAIDATHFEARDQAPPKEEKPEPKNVDVSPNKNGKNGWQNKLKKKLINPYMKSLSKPNLM